MKWNIEKKADKVYVTLTVKHVRTQRRWTNTSYTSEDALQYLQEQNITVDKMIQDDIVHNYQRESNLTGTWVFSLPSKPKTKKTSKPLEKKENVPKMTNKKTIKK
tara:strand:- start:341 stop:655 length:315 start_codon:yes stop_codon:yes gene_type:complete